MKKLTAQQQYDRIAYGRLKREMDNYLDVQLRFEWWLPWCEKELGGQHDPTLARYGALGMALWEKKMAAMFILKRGISGMYRRRTNYG